MNTISTSYAYASATLPISLADAKAYLMVNFTEQDALITKLLTSAIELFTKYTGILTKPATVTVRFSQEYDSVFRALLPFFPITSEPERTNDIETFTYTYDAGHATLPPEMELIILDMLSHFYEIRGVDSRFSDRLLSQIRSVSNYV